ncbi:penicillin acylase family protein [Corallococcus macrosporus]|uniref:Penicillin acylase n=1 Tax=Corallococcus macrosporus DSM 14697 TaxID=1189310 RepID=A0A250JVW7_9BACT|nr:penicillin acylase family protein [Corallococcus macrosporus]ATB47256.1 penicillin acylase [Corallococcus macrosporus DSM 14697]
MHPKFHPPLRRGVFPRTRNTRWQFSLLAGLSLLFTSACGDDGDDGTVPEPTPTYEATIRRTAHGVPHITGKDMGSVAYGNGYAFAQDHVCILADQLLKVRGERARYLGQGPGSTYAGSDFAYRALGLHDRAKARFGQQSATIQAMLKGYAAGFNRYLEETPKDQLPAPCTNAAWVKPISEVDLLAYAFSAALTGSSYQLILAIAAATPPNVTAEAIGTPARDHVKITRPETHQVGSNGWAIGRDRSASGHGMVVANPHFPWEGELKLWESHLTVPGELDIYGVGLLGVPAVLIGFNNDVAWTHTFSSGQRMTLYGLRLVPGKPTSYVYDGEEREMTWKDINILVRLDNGLLLNVTRRIYFSHYGPIISIPGTAEWTEQSVLTYRDANLENDTLLAQFVGMNQAKSLDEFKAVYAREQGIPWVNTMAADRAGNTWYTDATPTPNLSPVALATWNAARQGADPATTLLWNQMGLVLLDGSTSSNEWQDEEGARSPGLVPFSKVPKLDRTDFVFNANDSYWLANPAAPLTGYSPMHGLEGVVQTPRTRLNAVMLTEVAENGASGADGKFTRAELQDAILNNRGMIAELFLDDVVARCTGQTEVPHGSGTVDISQACALLAQWDRRYDVDSVGAIVWREFAGAFPFAELQASPVLYAQPFDPANPIATPHTLAPAPAEGVDPVLAKLAQAVDTLTRAGLSLDLPLGEAQFSPRVSGERIPIHGATNYDGAANIVGFGTLKSTTPAAEVGTATREVINARTGLSRGGYVVNNGSSFIMAMEFTDTGVAANALLTYSESSDPASEYYADQTRLFSQKQWRPILFTAEEVAAAPAEQLTLTGD